jgi:predicted house-cleaning noncanonical NTP pyrophosphatase (MazG superfamily)
VDRDVFIEFGIKIKNFFYKYEIMKQYNKLVRDKIPDILKGKKVKFKTHIAGNKEYLDKLYEKLTEELEEFKTKPSVEEFGDMLEVLESIGRYHKLDLAEIKMMKKMKKDTNGGFDKKIILDETD